MAQSCWLLSALLAIAFAPTAGRITRGDWGGDHVHLVATSRGGTIEFDCGHGTLDGVLRVDAGGRFDVRGRYFGEHAGPVRKDEAADATPARYAGSLRGGLLTLTVTLSGGETLGPFELRRGQRPRLMKCR
jgi:hypothetical protein